MLLLLPAAASIQWLARSLDWRIRWRTMLLLLLPRLRQLSACFLTNLLKFSFLFGLLLKPTSAASQRRSGSACKSRADCPAFPSKCGLGPFRCIRRACRLNTKTLPPSSSFNALKMDCIAPEEPTQLAADFFNCRVVEVRGLAFFSAPLIRSEHPI